MSTTPSPIDLAIDPVTPGSTWVCVTPQGRGLPVRIIEASPNSVEFRAIGRAAAADKPIRLPKNVFTARYSLVEDVQARQQELQREEREGRTPILGDSNTGLAPSLPPIARKAQSRRVYSLNRETVREIFSLWQDTKTPLREIAEAYNIEWYVIRDITRGHSYAAFTADLRQTPPRPRAVRKTSHTLSSRGTLTRDVARAIWLDTRNMPSISRATDDEVGRKYGVLGHVVRDIRLSRTYQWAYSDLVTEQPELARSTVGHASYTRHQEDPTQVTVPTLAHTPTPVAQTTATATTTESAESTELRPLVLELIEAADLLLRNREVPQSKFMKLDFEQIRATIEQAKIHFGYQS